MNKVFSLCGWTGNAYMQFMDDCMQTLPVVHSSGACFTQNGLTYVLDEQEEDVLSYAQFPKVAVDFFEKRANKKYQVDSKNADAENKVHPM